MIYVPLTIKSISIIGTSVRHQLATLSARPLSLFFFSAMHCISNWHPYSFVAHRRHGWINTFSVPR